MYKLYVNEAEFAEYESQEIATKKADQMLCGLRKFSLVAELNNMQAEATQGVENSKVFESKYSIPLYFVNLILSKFNMRIEVEK